MSKEKKLAGVYKFKNYGIIKTKMMIVGERDDFEKSYGSTVNRRVKNAK